MAKQQAGAAGPGRLASMEPLRSSEFRKLLSATTLQFLSMPLQFLTLTFFIQDRFPDQSVLFVSIVFGVRGIALLTMSFVGGAIADRFQRRRVLLGAESLNFVTTIYLGTMMILMPLGDATIVLILLGVFMASTAMAIDQPARNASIPSVVRMHEMPAAIGLNMLVSWIAFPAILPFAGWVNETFDPARVYLGSALIWVAIIPIIASLKYESRGDPNAKAGMVREIRAGLSYSLRNTAIFAVMSMVVVLHVVGMPGPGQLGPLWMTDVLDLSRAQFGLMGMTWGLGAVIGSVMLTLRPGLARRGSTLCFAVVMFAVCAIVFAHSRFIPATALANAGLGAAMAMSMVTAQTLLQYFASEEMRGRVMGLMPLVMGMSMLGALPVGITAQQTSLEVVLPTLAWAMLAIAATVIILRPELRRSSGGSGARAVSSNQVKPA